MEYVSFKRKYDVLSERILDAVSNPDEIRWLYIEAVLKLMGGNVSATARRLGMHRRSLQRTISANTRPSKAKGTNIKADKDAKE